MYPETTGKDFSCSPKDNFDMFLQEHSSLGQNQGLLLAGLHKPVTKWRFFSEPKRLGTLSQHADNAQWMTNQVFNSQKLRIKLRTIPPAFQNCVCRNFAYNFSILRTSCTQYVQLAWRRTVSLATCKRVVPWTMKIHLKQKVVNKCGYTIELRIKPAAQVNWTVHLAQYISAFSLSRSIMYLNCCMYRDVRGLKRKRASLSIPWQCRDTSVDQFCKSARFQGPAGRPG